MQNNGKNVKKGKVRYQFQDKIRVETRKEIIECIDVQMKMSKGAKKIQAGSSLVRPALDLSARWLRNTFSFYGK